MQYDLKKVNADVQVNEKEMLEAIMSVTEGLVGDPMSLTALKADFKAWLQQGKTSFEHVMQLDLDTFASFKLNKSESQVGGQLCFCLGSKNEMAVEGQAIKIVATNDKGREILRQIVKKRVGVAVAELMQ